MVTVYSYPRPLVTNCYELGLDPHDSNVTKGDTAITYWGVDDIEKEYNRMIELGAQEHSKPTNVGGEIMVATVKDLWGM